MLRLAACCRPSLLLLTTVCHTLHARITHRARSPPALPAINLLTGQPEPIEPSIWRTVAAQVALRPGQRQRLAAAWQLYNASLESVNAERARLSERLRDALARSQLAGGAASSSGVPDAAALDALLAADEYTALSAELDANMAREDGIMVLHDYVIGCMMDGVQLALVCVSCWPFLPLAGCVAAHLLGVDDGEEGGGGGEDGA